jgi:hypothetical protein
MECFSEPTLDEVLSDPLVMDVMASDGVDPGELEAELVAVAGDIRRHGPKRRSRQDRSMPA